jgi:methylenetetrahydrofolate reductase (NADPH)
MDAIRPGHTDRFLITVEVVPPAGADIQSLLTALQSLQGLPVDGFSVATNPVAKPRMSAMALCALLQQQTGRPAILHCTTRDHNRLSLQGMLWGALALGIETVLVTTGDFVALGDRATTTDVGDTDVFGLIAMARNTGLHTGVVFDPGPASGGLEKPVRRLERKIAAGAQFVVTQPYYDETGTDELAAATRHVDIPIILGILPLRTPRHAEFLNDKVAGINVPKQVRERINRAEDPIAEGLANARRMLDLARERFAGACLMPPFDRYNMLKSILSDPIFF